MWENLFRKWIEDSIEDGSIVLEDILFLRSKRETQDRVLTLFRLWAREVAEDLEPQLISMIQSVAMDKAAQ